MIFGNKIFKEKHFTISAFNSQEFKEAFEALEDLRKTYFLLGYIRYEAKDIFLGHEIKSALPLLYFEAYKNFQEYTPSSEKNFNLEPVCDLTYTEYAEKIAEIKRQIQKGNTYEVNYTCNFSVAFTGDEFALFESLLQKQKTPYCSYIQNDFETILSFSPELFFRVDKNRHIVTKPMKGTVKRGNSSQQDEALKEFLHNDEKNRAENAMIVDLLRNDLSKIAKKCSVCVPKLFDVETYPTVFQMISQVDADLRDNVNLYELFEALFPCGSITGAPKISTMEIIDQIEDGKRDIYCGAIGLISADEMEISVPIRILQKTKDENVFRYRSGGAIVWDSKAEDEWNEIITKTSILRSDFNILETVKIENGKALFFQEHLERMEKTALFYNYPFDKKQIKLDLAQDGMVRILLNKNGRFDIQYRPLTDITSNRITVSQTSTHSKDIFLQHKTDFRPYYQVDYTHIFDEIFFNEKGELTEGSRSNVLIQQGGKLYTPPLECGLLSGIYRQKMLDEGACEEKILYLDDVLQAEKIYCVNSVRGIHEVKLIKENQDGINR